MTNSRRSVVSPRRTTSSPGPAFGPSAVRTNITDSSDPSNSGRRELRLAETYSAAARSAAIRCNAMPIASPRWMRPRPRFQFGSHCAVTLASAESTSPISANAMMASISVNPRFAGAPVGRSQRSFGQPRHQANGANVGHRAARRSDANPDQLGHPRRVGRWPGPSAAERGDIDCPAVTVDLPRRVPARSSARGGMPAVIAVRAACVSATCCSNERAPRRLVAISEPIGDDHDGHQRQRDQHLDDRKAGISSVGPAIS